ncbi:hypothetical protein ACFU99_07710 [Streptomyces sp. NPDC057654]
MAPIRSATEITIEGTSEGLTAARRFAMMVVVDGYLDAKRLRPA